MNLAERQDSGQEDATPILSAENISTPLLDGVAMLRSSGVVVDSTRELPEKDGNVSAVIADHMHSKWSVEIAI